MVTMRRHKRSARRGVSIASFALLAFAGCGLFSPRDSEFPVAPGRVDPLSFASILDATPEHFTRLRYEDMFDDRLRYEDINSGVSGKGQLVQRLQQIQGNYPSIQVTWTGGQWRTRNDTIFISDITYTVLLQGTQDPAAMETGASNFVVAKEWEWRIVDWRDVPAKPDKSFFSP